jgi:hypothetical protein
MWYKEIENAEKINILYNGQPPLLNSINIERCEIQFGEDNIFSILLETKELPIPMPRKWIEQNCDTVRIMLDFLSSDIRTFSICTNNFKNLSLDIQNNDGVKKTTISDSDGNLLLQLTSKWIYINNVSAYKNC